MPRSRLPPSCFFPSLAPLPDQRSLCREEASRSTSRSLNSSLQETLPGWLHDENVSLLSLMQTAWAVTLRSYTGGDHVCFSSDGGLYESHVDGSTSIRDLLHNKRQDCTCEGTTASGGRIVYNTAVTVSAGHSNKADVQIYVDASLAISIEYNTSILSNRQASSVLETLQRVVSESMRKRNATVGDLDICSDADLQLVSQWNSPLVHTEYQNICAYDVLTRQCRDYPDSPAISAWDGEMTYGELDRVSSVLAQRLLNSGVGPNQIVLVYSEKSKWAPVSVVAIIKSGAAFLLVDGSNGLDYLQMARDTVSANLIICSPSRLATAQRSGLRTICFGDWIENTPVPDLPSPPCKPSNLLYAVFTSGSTKSPKCVAMDDGACCYSTLSTANALGISRHTRRLQFSSYSWTMCIRETMCSLLLGGCLCIPSEEDRRSASGLASFMNNHQVTFANFTPAFANLPEPGDVPSLQTLMLGGEPVPPALVKKWANRVHLIVGYGASETAGIGLKVPDSTRLADHSIIGARADPCLWVVDMDNPHRLAPLGAVGELVLQGPGLGRGYLKNEEQTRERFLHQLDWQARVPGSDAAGGLYRTGDLVRYTMDGSIRLVGRREDVLKLNGQLVGLRDLEDRVRTSPEAQRLGVKGVAVIAVSLPSGKTGHVAFIEGSSLAQSPQEYIVRDGLHVVEPSKCTSFVEAIKHDLAAVIPPDLVPGHMFFIQSLLRFHPSGKINRRILPSIAGELIARSSSSPSRCNMCKDMHLHPAVQEEIEDIAPTTEFQRWTLTAMNYRYFTIPMPPDVDRTRLLQAVQELVNRHSSLRTAFAKDNSGKILQVVLQHLDVQFHEHSADTLEHHCKQDSTGLPLPPIDGNPPFQAQLVTLANADLVLALRMVHAQYDGLSWAIMAKDISASYNGTPLNPTAPFSAHARAALALEKAESYEVWRNVLRDSRMTSLASLSQDTNHNTAEPTLIVSNKNISNITPPEGVTLATVIKTAWALTLRQTLPTRDINDIVFGQVVHGRVLGIPHEKHIIGPCIDIIPVRVQITSQTKLELLRKVRQQHLDTVQHSHLGFSNLLKNCTSWPADTKWGSFVRVHNFDVYPICRIGEVDCRAKQITIPNRPSETANLCVIPGVDGLAVTMGISSAVMEQERADGVVEMFCRVLRDLVINTDRVVS
ncbi:hypothetical protein BDV18DRAFT_162934 [Aspergillus unguis]